MMYSAADFFRLSDCKRRDEAYFKDFRSTFHSGEVELRVYGMPVTVEDIAIPLIEDGDGSSVIPDGDATITYLDEHGQRVTKAVRVLWGTGRQAREFRGIPVGEAAVTDAVAEWMEANWTAIESDAADKWRDGP